MKTSLLLASSLLLAGACADTDDLEQAYGGLDTADEAPEFGDPDAFAAATLEADAPVTDPMVLQLPAGGLHARVVLLWGQLPPDLANDEVAVDWSGTLSVNRGGLAVRHRIGFEAATDRILPRTDPAVLAFDSVTRPFVDGLVLEVVDPDPANAEPMTLTYTRNDGVTHAIELATLLDGPIVRTVDDQGDKVIATALRTGDPCDHGFARGRWHALDDGRGGLIGMVVDEDGTPAGHIRGVWGERQSGERVFFGKYIAADGQFRGIFAGHYDGGDLIGRWVTRSGDHGRLQGHYDASAPGPRAGGHFVLRWAETSCAQDLPSDAP